MPYITQEERKPIDRALEPITMYIEDYDLTEGQLNYIITRLCLAAKKKEGLRYTTLNAIIGALECAKLEFYRQIVADYEDTKIIANGNVT